MDRREFSALAGASGAAVFGLPTTAAAQARAPKEGSDYVELERPAKVAAPAGKIEVVEFFWYSCQHCNRFEPELESWIKKVKPDVAVRRVPVAFRDEMVPQQRLFYALEALGMVAAQHARVFAAIHGAKRALSTQSQIADWATDSGIDRVKFLAQYNSFTVSSKARAASELQQQYQVGGVPALGIAGRFYTDGALAQSMSRALFVTDYLLDNLRKKKI